MEPSALTLSRLQTLTPNSPTIDGIAVNCVFIEITMNENFEPLSIYSQATVVENGFFMFFGCLGGLENENPLTLVLEIS